MSEPRTTRLGAVLAVALLVLPIAGVAWWLNRPKAEPGSGPGLADLDVVCLGRIDGLAPVASLEPAVPGKVAAVFVAEGQPVRAKDKLLKLDDETFQLKLEETKAAVAAADVEIAAAKLEESLFPKREAIQTAAVTAAADRVATASRLLKEKETARTFGTVTAAEVIAAEAEVEHLKQLKGIEQSRLDELKASAPGFALKVRAADARRAVADVARRQAEKAARDCVLLAPADGVVLRVQTTVGESVAPGTPLPPIVFRPDGPLVVRAELEQEFLGRVKPGMKATIRDDARPDSPTWTGRVLRVGSWVARKKSILLDPGEMNDVRTVECVVTLDGNPEGLLVGQRMRVRIGRAE